MYTGTGKGKTTAALGLALRAAGSGKRVYIAQFCKGAFCSEHVALARFRDLITCVRYGSGAFVTDTLTDQDTYRARRGWNEVKRVVSSGKYQLVILDEANVAMHLGLLSVDAVCALIDDRPVDLELVLTGRNAPAPIIARADLVTDMVSVKHYYDCGSGARRGIEL